MIPEHTLEVATRVAVIVGYSTAIITGYCAWRQTRIWARRVSAVAIILGSVYWIGFYGYLLDADFSVVGPQVVWSRIGHYLMAACLITMALGIGRAEKYARKAKRDLSIQLAQLGIEE